MPEEPILKRHLNTVTLTFYGVGVIIGAGIYVLVGKLAGMAGNVIWLAFIVSAIAALPTGLSYAELASRYPKSAGEAVYADRAFNHGTLSFIVGFLILASGVASTAAVSHGFAHYLREFIGIPHWVGIVILLSMLTLLNHRGIREATWANVLCTTIEAGTLILLTVLGISYWGHVDYLAVPVSGGMEAATGAVILSGAALAFYAFIGFEDICNVAEEVKAPERTIPRAILLAMVITTIIYIAFTITAVSVVPAQQLAASDVPMVLLADTLVPGLSNKWISLVALFAIFNTGLINMIMVSRILYGMGQSGWIPVGFSRVHRTRQTPTVGVISAYVLTLAFALTGFLKVLAESTNTIILSAFFLVNLSLVVVKLKKVPADNPTAGHFRVPTIVPILGMLITAYMVSQFTFGAYVRALGLVSVGVVLYAVHSRK